ncbi:hypothetical protein TSAR_007147, partial [Trichomalopsis sarcophagae]
MDDGLIDSITGIYFAILEVLSEHFNFTLKLVTNLNAKDTDGFLKFAQEQMLTESVDVLSTPFPFSKYTIGLEFGFIADFMKITEDSTYGDCIQMLRQRQARMCLLPKETAEEIASNANNSLFMKSSRYVFAEVMRGYFYPKASPYVGKFDKIMQRIRESAMQHTWKDYRKYYRREMSRDKTGQDLKESISEIKLLYLIIIGH